MIKYPVVVVESAYCDGRFWVTSSGVADCNYISSSNSKAEADIIANSLNAMNEFPELAEVNFNLMDWYWKQNELMELD